MTIQETLKKGTAKLKGKSSSPRLDAEVLLCHVLKKNKEFIYSHNSLLTVPQLKTYHLLLDKRSSGIPIAYLTNHKEFYGLDLYVNRHVLIPRPETEILVKNSLSVILNFPALTNASRGRSKDRQNKTIEIADIGTGAGGVAIAIVVGTQHGAVIHATDICARALSVAKKNAKTHKVTSKIKFHQGNLLEPIKHKKLDLIIANLPYLNLKWKNKTIDKEPQKALFTGENGLQLYRELIEQSLQMKQLPKLMLFEYDPRQTTEFKRLIKKHLPKAKLEIIKDLAGHDRVMKITN